ncbi:hypothetical protein ACFQNJ_13115 [Hydrogenophaga bisanensis]|uniref:Uncharacterized protein n=1 Tax=Hydrogenophaga bisanensis TaxID=439611 RepID=A0ABW2RBH3_9BURK
MRTSFVGEVMEYVAAQGMQNPEQCHQIVPGDEALVIANFQAIRSDDELMSAQAIAII